MAYLIPFIDSQKDEATPSQDECDIAFLVHILPAICNLVFLGFGVQLVVPFFVLMLVKRKTSFVMFHINQSLYFQGIIFALYIPLFAFCTLITMLTWGLGFFLYFFPACVLIAGVAYPIMVGLAARNGEWRQYAYIGERVLVSERPFMK